MSTHTTTRARRLLLAAAALATLACGGAGDAGEEGSGRSRRLARLDIGDAAPAYRATSLDGDSVSLAGLRGQAVLLNIWATWCHPCRTEIPELERLYQEHRARGLTIVGVSIDAGGEDGAVRDFAREYGMTFPIWRDPDGRVSTTFAAIGVPATYLIDREGVLRWRRVGPIAEGDTSLVRALDEALGDPPPGA